MVHFALIALVALQLFLAVAVLFSVGFVSSRLTGPFWFSRRLSPAHLVALGQLVVVLEFYLRSFANHLIGRVVPITALDVVALLLVLMLALYWKGGLRQASRVLWEARVELALFALIAATLLFIIAWDELPRVTMLSGDPDQHAFWARQVQRFRTLPYFHQFWWGDIDFEYPGGFAILNYVWMSLSGLEARQIVSVQTLLQVQIAILVLFETIRRTEHEPPWRTLVAIMLGFLVYYQSLPYGYERSHYALEGTGRTASILFAALPLDLLIFGLRHRRTEVARDLSVAPQACLLGFSAVVASWINVLNLPYVLAMSAGGLVPLVTARPNWRRAVAALLLLAPLPAVIVDPYYMKRFLFHATGRVMSETPAALLPLSMLPSRWAESVALSLGHPIHFTSELLRTDLLSDGGTAVVCAILAASVFAVGLGWRRRTAASLAVALALVFAIRALVLPLTVALRPFGPDYYLLSKYVETSRQQFVILILYAYIALLAIELARLPPIRILILGLAVVVFLRVAPNTEIGPRQRQSYPNPMGDSTPADLNVIRQAEALFRRWRSEHPQLDFSSVPRILIPNGIFHNNEENWLLPLGASRILPLADVFPAAFFYFQGSREYTFEAYLEHVCNHFDIEWLLAHNIHYLFLPVERGLVCVDNLDGVLASTRIVARDGNAELLEISAQLPR